MDEEQHANPADFSALTEENVLKVIRSIDDISKKWEDLSYKLLGHSNATWKSEEDAVREWFHDDRHTPSWRKLTFALDKLGEIKVADTSQKYCEVPNDPTMTTENVLAVLSISDPKLIRKFWTADGQNLLSEVPSRVASIEEHFTEDEDRNKALLNYYVNCHPEPMWYYIACCLYSLGETAALKKVYEFKLFQTEDSLLTTENVSAILMHWIPRPDFGKYIRTKERHSNITYGYTYTYLPLIPPAILKTVNEETREEEDHYFKYTEYYVKHHPDASWYDLATRMYEADAEPASLKQLTPFLPNDHSLTTKNISEILEDFDNWKQVFAFCGVTWSNIDRTEQGDALIEHYVTVFPLRSWMNLSYGLKSRGHYKLVENVKIKYLQDDTMDVLPVIADQPTSQNASYGEEVTLSVSATGTGSLSYYWIKDGDAYFGEKLSHCTGSNTSSLHISAFSPSHEGRYKCVVSNKAGSVESNTVTLSASADLSALTEENVLKVIRSIDDISKKWKDLSHKLLGYSNATWKSGEDVVREWFHKDYHTPSWRKLIYTLDKLGETKVANELIQKNLSEPVDEATMTVANVKAVLSLMNPDIKTWFLDDVPMRAAAIESEFPETDAQNHALASYYVDCYSEPSWEYFARSLYIFGDTAALEKLYSLCPLQKKDSSLTTENVSANMVHWAPKDWKRTFSHMEIKIRYGYNMSFVSPIQIEAIEKTYESIEEIYNACADYYVKYHPDASWHNLATHMYETDADLAALRQLSPFLPPKDSSVTAENLHEIIKDLDEMEYLKLFGTYGVEFQVIHDYDAENREANIDDYVKRYPLLSWKNLISGLREIGHPELAEKVRFKYVQGSTEDVISPPVITKYPEYLDNIHEDRPLTLTVSAAGQGTLSYHWIKDGLAFFDEKLPSCTGVNTPTLGITSFATEHEGVYKCVVSNAAGSVESTSVELTIDDSQKEIDEYVLPIIAKEGYSCVAKSSLCAFYLPKGYMGTVYVENVTLDPKPRANEVVIAPVVRVTSHGLTISEKKPAIIELMKIVDVSDTSQNELVPLLSNSVPSKNLQWKELDTNSHCEVLNDRIRFQVTQLGFFTALTRYKPPSGSVSLLPNDKHPVELTIPEVPGFKVQIPSTSVQSETLIKATLHYDDPVLCTDGKDYCLATACVTIEPRNLRLTETTTIPVTLTIPDYNEIRKKYPNAKPQFLCGTVHTQSKESTTLDWEVVSEEDFIISKNDDNHFAATIQSTSFGPLKGIWRGVSGDYRDLGPKHEYRKSITETKIKSISARCQVFMSPITKMESSVSFNVAVLVYPFQASKVYKTLENYECSLCDSGPVPYEFKGSDLLYTLEIRKLLFPESKQNARNLSYSETASLSGDFCSRAEFEIEFDASAKLKGGMALANLFIKHSADKPHKFSLILPQNLVLQDEHYHKEPTLEGPGLDSRMKLSEFCQDASRGDGRVVLNEIFEVYLKNYLESKGLDLDENSLEEDSMDEAFSDARYDFSEVTVCFDPRKNFKPIERHEKFCCTSVVHTNREDKECIRHHTTTIEKTEGLEYCDAKTWTWSTSGGLSAKYQGVGASVSIGYTKSQSQTLKKNDISVCRQDFPHEVEIPKKSSRKVEMKQRYSCYECKVENAIIKFPKGAQIRCTVIDKQSRTFCPWSWCDWLSKSKQRFDLGEIFKGSLEESPHDNKFIAKINGKYKWVETDIFSDIKDPVKL